MKTSIMFVIALVIQCIFFGLFFFIDAKQTVAESWQQVVRFGLNPLVILFFGLSPLALWWSYRTIFHAMGSFWLSSLLSGCFLQVVYILCSYAGSSEIPSRGEWLAIVLSTVGIVVGRLIK